MSTPASGPDDQFERSVLQQELDATRRELELVRAQWSAVRGVQAVGRKLRLDPHRSLPAPAVRLATASMTAARKALGKPAVHRSADRPARRAGAILGGDGDSHVYLPYARVLDGEIAPLVPPALGAVAGRMRIALVIPPFDFGSGGHAVVFQAGAELERLGHVVSYWQHDPFGERTGMTDAGLQESIQREFPAVRGAAHVDLSDWEGADVAVATGWQTAYPVMGLSGCAARAYLVNDHEPEFYATSLESFYAAETYRLGLPAIVGGGGWLAQTLRARYGTEPVAVYDYPVAGAFRERPIERRDDTIVVYGRITTPRRAVGLAQMALEELHRRRPGLRFVLFGDRAAPSTPYPYEHLGPIDPEELSWVYSEATVGLAFSLTHASLVPNDMMACGLPVVGLAGYGTGVEHAESGLVELTPPSPFAVADAVERLLDDPALRATRSAEAAAHVQRRSWADAAVQIERGLRSLVVAAQLEADAAAR